MEQNATYKDKLRSERTGIAVNKQQQYAQARSIYNKTKSDIDNSGSVVGDITTGAMQALPMLFAG